MRKLDEEVSGCLFPERWQLSPEYAIVGGYSGIGKKNIKELEKSYPDIEVKQFSNRL